MALETGTYISDLVVTNPGASDAKSQGDDHLRLLKSTLKATFPNVAGAVTPTHVEINYVGGVTSAIQTQINTKGAIAGQAWSGSHDFTLANATVSTKPSGNNSTSAASTAYADAAVSAEALIRSNADALLAPSASPAFTGIPTAPTAAPGTSSTQIATMAALANAAFSAVLPAQAGNAGKFVTTDGTTASWGVVTAPEPVLFYNLGIN